jgi:hypothetical protein
MQIFMPFVFIKFLPEGWASTFVTFRRRSHWAGERKATDCLDNHGNLRLFAAALGPGHAIAALTAYIFSAPHVSMSE